MADAGHVPLPAPPRPLLAERVCIYMFVTHVRAHSPCTQVPFLVVRAYGMIGYMRLAVAEHTGGLVGGYYFAMLPKIFLALSTYLTLSLFCGHSITEALLLCMFPLTPLASPMQSQNQRLQSAASV